MTTNPKPTHKPTRQADDTAPVRKADGSTDHAATALKLIKHAHRNPVVAVRRR